MSFDYDDDPDAPLDQDLDNDEEDELIDCPACGQSIYDDTEKCPYCGDWIVATAGSTARNRIWILGAILALMSMIVFAVL